MTESGGRLRDGVLLEWYRYPPGPAVTLPGHVHEEYQFNVNLDVVGGVHYRGAFHVVPAGGLAVVMPGEHHTPRDPDDIGDWSRHLTLYVDTARMRAVAGEIDPGRTGTPTFRELVMQEPDTVRRFVRSHAALSRTALAGDVALAELLAVLLTRHTAVSGPAAVPATHRAVRRARDYLHAHVSEQVTLTELAAVAELSPYRLVRLFRAAVGIPPHTYQNHLRLEYAKRLLLAGTPTSLAGHLAGFYDLSHFTRHFKRYVGVPPGRYASRGNDVHSADGGPA